MIVKVNSGPGTRAPLKATIKENEAIIQIVLKFKADIPYTTAGGASTRRVYLAESSSLRFEAALSGALGVRRLRTHKFLPVSRRIM